MNNQLGLSLNDYEFIKDSILRVCQNKESVTIKVFGSRARGDYKKYSDLDLWLEVSPVLTDTELMNLRELFEDSDLPIKIDIVTPETVLAEYLPNISRELKLF